MEVYKIYTNAVNQVAHGSLLSDTVITNIPLVSCFADSHKTHIVDSSAKTVDERVFALGSRRKSRTFSTHCCARNDKVEYYW